jgi:hypothetical protein
MSFYDTDAILTDAQKLPCTFNLDVPGLGYLDGNPGEPIAANAKLELPLWLGMMLTVANAFVYLSSVGQFHCSSWRSSSHKTQPY